MTITLNGSTGITTPDIDSVAAPDLVGTNFTSLPSGQLVGNLPALNGSSLTSLTSANLTGALPAIDGSALTGVGASTTAGAVGTYAWLVNRTQDNGSAWGGTMAGSSLGSAGLATNNNTNASSSGNVTASGRSIGTTQTGTWRAMGQSNFSGMYDSRTTLFVRIA